MPFNPAWPHGLQETCAWQSEIMITCNVKGPQFFHSKREVRNVSVIVGRYRKYRKHVRQEFWKNPNLWFKTAHNLARLTYINIIFDDVSFCVGPQCVSSFRSHSVFDLLTVGVEGFCFIFTWSHRDTHHSRWGSSGWRIGPSQRPLPDNTQHSQETKIHAPGGIRTQDPNKRSVADLRLRPRDHWDRHCVSYQHKCLLRTLISGVIRFTEILKHNVISGEL
jgi:hypothetical protein